MAYLSSEWARQGRGEVPTGELVKLRVQKECDLDRVLVWHTIRNGDEPYFNPRIRNESSYYDAWL